MSRGTTFGTVFVQNFGNEAEAEAAVESLIEAGFSTKDISVVFSTHATAAASVPSKGFDRTEALEVPSVGRVVGGPLLSVLGKWDEKTTSGRLSRALRELGIEREEARYYRDRSEAGDIVVVAVMGGKEAK